MNPKVSIVIACYNDPEVVVAVQSAIDQTYENKEIILVDDGSGNEVKRIINSIKKNVDLIVTKENGGQGSARNRGIEKATGEFILNLDSDDHFEKSFCEKAVKVLLIDENVKIVTCHAKRFTKKGTVDIFYPKGGAIAEFLFSNSALGSSMFKRKDWLKSGGYNEKREMWGFEDWDFYIQLLKSGGSAYVIPEVLFNYQLRAGSTTVKISNLKLEKFKMIVFNHEELYQSNWEALVNYLFEKIKIEEEEKIKRINSLEFTLGKNLLFPLRRMRKFFKI